MIIRKLFKFRGLHIVRQCSSERCKLSTHSHTYQVEVFLTSDKLDNGQMIYDFGLMKTTIKELIKSFDCAWSYWNKEEVKYETIVKKLSSRWIKMPCSPSAESYSLMFLYIIDKILNNTKFQNNEGNVKVSSVRVHETKTGYAEAFRNDLKWVNYKLEDIIFSDEIINNWSENWWLNLKTKKLFINKLP